MSRTLRKPKRKNMVAEEAWMSDFDLTLNSE